MLIEPDWQVARAAAHAAAVPLTTEAIDVASADQRVLATDLAALTPLPPSDVSAMDGWAVSGDGPWTIFGGVLAGDTPRRTLRAGQCLAIATGAMLPDGCTGVLRSEHTTVLDDGRIDGAVGVGQDIRRAGEECRADEVIVSRGTLLTPVHLGLIAAAGHDRVTVVRRPRALVLICGDELLDGGPARDGKVRDSLGPQVPAWLARVGIDVVAVRRVVDTLPALVEAMAAAVGVDLLVTTGGTAAGPVDLVRQALAATGGSLLIDEVAVKPGHPMLLGAWGQPASTWLVGLPGNPQAAVAALSTLALPLVEGLNGQPLALLSRRTCTESVSSHGAKTRLVSCVSDDRTCTPTPHIGSGMLRGLSGAHGFAVIPAGGASPGDTVDWLPLF